MTRLTKEREAEIRSSSVYECGNPQVQSVYKELFAEIDALRADKDSWGNEFIAVMILKGENEKLWRALEENGIHRHGLEDRCKTCAALEVSDPKTKEASKDYSIKQYASYGPSTTALSHIDFLAGAEYMRARILGMLRECKSYEIDLFMLDWLEEELKK